MIENEQAVTDQQRKRIQISKPIIDEPEETEKEKQIKIELETEKEKEIEKEKESKFTRTTKVRKTRKARGKKDREKLRTESKKKKKQNKEIEDDLEGNSVGSIALKEGDKFLIDDKNKLAQIQESQKNYYEKLIMEHDENDENNNSKIEKEKEILDKVGNNLATFGLDKKAIKRDIRNRSRKKDDITEKGDKENDDEDDSEKIKPENIDKIDEKKSDEEQEITNVKKKRKKEKKESC